MKILTYRTPLGLALGIKTHRGVIDVKAAAQALGRDDAPPNPALLFGGGLVGMPGLTGLLASALDEGDDAPWFLDETMLQFGPCAYQPQKILCIGLNYRRHAEESGSEVPDVPVLFSKFNNALLGHQQPITLPAHVKEYDYEVELAVMIGKPAKYVSEEKALDYVLGYCNANDVSARDLQMRTSQWLLGKTLDGFCPLGPYLVTADEVDDPQQLSTRSWLNGELRQDSNTSDMIFTVAEIISYLSQYMTLLPGDIILTGTPEGVILGMEEKSWMEPGDVVSVEVGNLGKLTNHLVKER